MLTLNLSPCYQHHIENLAKQQISIEQFVINHLPPMPVDFDMERMEKALQSERFVVPQGLTAEQFLEHMLANAK